MRVLILTQGQHTVVDDDVFTWASRVKWCATKNRYTFYARRTIRHLDGSRSVEYLHRKILGIGAGEKVAVDHKDGDGLNNQRENLRSCSPAENRHNSRLFKTNTSGFRGVSFNQRNGRWRAIIREVGKQKYLGHFDSALDAANAYDVAASAIFGGFAKVNFPV